MNQAKEFGRMAERAGDPTLREKLYEIGRRCEAIAKEMEKADAAHPPPESND